VVAVRRVYTLALSDPSFIELLAILVGVASGFTGFLYISTSLAYQAAVVASPIKPFDKIPGYVLGFHQPIVVPSISDVAAGAGAVYAKYVLRGELSIWMIYLLSLSISLYPLLSRFKSAMVPAMSITGLPLSRVVWGLLVPAIAVSAGYVSMFIALFTSVYLLYFNTPLTIEFAECMASLGVYMLAAPVVMYVAMVATGREYFGMVLVFLLSLAVDRANIPVHHLLLLSLLLLASSLLVLAILVWRRWVSL